MVRERLVCFGLLALGGCSISLKSPSPYDGAYDQDHDGFGPGDDCDDLDPQVNPNSDEVCDDVGVDEDCDGLVNEADPSLTDGVWRFRDEDGDGWGDRSQAAWRCDPAEDGWCSQPGDCDDAHALANPEGEDPSTDGVDQDCDGLDGPDRDEDGYADAATGGRDCDDTDWAVNPSHREVCDPTGVDEDCDGLVNDDDPDATGTRDWYEDHDNDGYGAGAAIAHCDPLPGTRDNADDCDDSDPLISPATLELCGDGIVQGCGRSEDEARAICALTKGRHSLNLEAVAVQAGPRQDGAGAVVALGGDMDGDGFAELALAGPSGTSTPGRVWIFEGAPITGHLSLEGASAVLTGRGTADRAGASLFIGGDADGDGLADLAVSVPGDMDGEPLGSTWLISGPVTADGVLGDRGVRVQSSADVSDLSLAVSLGGDADGDGLADLLVGDPLHSAAALYSGLSLGLAGEGGVILWEDADAALTGTASNDGAGAAVDLGGDLNGDGYGDLALTAPASGLARKKGGLVAVLQGPVGGAVDLNDADALVGGDQNGAAIGQSVSIRGDTNGDGLDDLAITSTSVSGGGHATGGAWLLLGPVSGSATVAARDTQIFTSGGSGACCRGLALAGDLNADGRADLVLASPDLEGVSSQVGLFFGALRLGRVDRVAADVSLEDYAEGGLPGVHLSAGGDFDGDGFGDLLIGVAAPDAVSTGLGSVSYLVRGGSSAGAGY